MRRAALVLALVAASVCTGAAQVVPRSITVSAAVSLTDALTAIAKSYANEGHGSIQFNFGASNTLARQIVDGAPVDLFVSADEKEMDVVAEAHLVNEGTRIDLLSNQLAVVVPSDRPRTFKSVREIADPAFRRIALGDPAAVPAGVYAKQYLEKEGLWKEIEPRAVPSGSVRSALAAVESGAADAAIVYRTDARISLHATVAWVVPLDRGPRIRYAAAVIRTSARAGDAQRFLDYLRSASAAQVFANYGFVPVSAPAPAGR
jgi:molybdate transport system substrate-binding protein